MHIHYLHYKTNYTQKDVNMLKKLKTGKIIKKRRKELGMSADDLAKSIGKDRSTVYRYESGDISKLSIDMLEPLAEALKTDIAYLLGLNRCDTASVTIRTETVYAAYASTNKAHVQRLKKWVDYFGNEDFTDSEFEEIVSFANYLLHKRKSKGGD